MTTSSSRRARTPVPTSRHRGRPRRLRAVGICLGVVAAIGLTVPTATASHYQASLEGSAFQIEDNANFVVDADAEATLDWNNVEEARQGDLATGTNDDSYSGGVKEDTACPTTTTGSIPNNKSDLKTFGVYVEPGASPGDPGYLHLYWTRVSDPSGTTLMDFEFNQSTQACAVGRVNKVRTTDDLLIEYSIVQGGARAIITVRKWSGSAWGPADVFTANEATGTTNTSQILAANTGGVSDVNLNARTFGEASIDLDALFDDEKCTSFGSAMLKSRSSDSFTSQLKDFIAPLPINLSNCAQVIIRKKTIPEGEAQLFDFTKSFATDPASGNTFQLADGDDYTKGNVLLGEDLTVSEGDLPAGWEFDSLDCSESSGVEPSVNGKTATFDLDATTDIVDCTFNNSRLRGSIQVEKVVTSTDDRIDGASFVIDGDGNPATTNDQTAIPEVAGEVGLFCKDELLLGTYKVLETVAPAGYSGAGPAQTVLVTAASTCGDREADDTDATFENMAEPTIVTQAQTPVTVGETITDTATLSGGHNPTGVITFNAYLDDECTAPAAFTDTEPVDGNGDYTSDPYTTEGTGTVYWIASYGGDPSNAPVSGECGDDNESSLVTPQTPDIATQAQTPVTVGATITDTATLSGGLNPTGLITFKAYLDDECTEPAVFTDTADVDGNGDYISDPYTTEGTGTVYWIASYGGDGNNGAVSGACGDENESSVVNPETPDIVTDAQDSVVVGGTLTDTATLSGGYHPTGLITFTAYLDDECTAPPVFESVIKVDNGNADYTSGEYTTTGTGTVYWIASYGGDVNNDPVSGACGDENESSLVAPESPDIVTDAEDTVVVGGELTDTATLSGGYNPTGLITFKAYLDDECTDPAAFTDTAIVNGNGDYTSDPYETTGTGTVYWIASYGGDLNNEAVSGACGDENESSSVTPASPGIATTPRLLPNDSATLSGGFGTLTGTISFALFANADCTGTAMYTQGPIAVNGYGPYTTTNTSVFITADGTYSWEVTYSGDGNNNGAFSSCEAEQQVVDFTPLNLVP
jgi:hypothetical protein